MPFNIFVIGLGLILETVRTLRQLKRLHISPMYHMKKCMLGSTTSRDRLHTVGVQGIRAPKLLIHLLPYPSQITAFT